MAISKLAAVLNGLIQNRDLTAEEIQVGSVRYGGATGTLLDKTTLDSLVSNSHAAGSDNQNIVAGEGLTGGGSGSTVTLDIGAGDGITVSADSVAVNATVVRTSGSTMDSAANLTFQGGGEVLGLPATPSGAGAAASKAYVDSVAQGLSPKASAKAATDDALPAVTASGTKVGKTLTANANGVLVVDGVNTWFDVNNDGGTTDPTDPANTRASRVLVKDQVDPIDNGIYAVTDKGSASTPFVLTRAIDADTNSEIEAAFIFIREGTVNADSGWVLTTDTPDIDVTGLSFAQFSGAGSIEAGAGLVKSGNTIDIVAADSSLTVNADDIAVKLDPAGAIGLDAGSAGLEARVDDASIEISSNALQIKDLGVTTAKINDSAVTTVKIADSNVTTAKIADANITTDKLADDSVTAAKLNADTAGLGLTPNVTTGALDVNVDDSSIEIAIDTVQVKDLGITTAKLANGSVDSNKLAASVAGDGLSGGGGSALAVNVDTTSIEIVTDTLQVKDAGITTAKLADGSVTDAKVASGIDAAKIANGTVSNAEFQQLDGVTSPIQTQIDSKVTGPASATDNAITRYDGITGKLVQDSSVTISDTGVLSGATQLNVDNLSLDGTTLSSSTALNLTSSSGGSIDINSGTGGISLTSGTSVINVNSSKITNVADPVAAGDAANKRYVDASINGLDWKQSVRATTTANIDLSSMPSSIDGVSLAVGNRFLAKDQTTASENGIYVFNGTASAATRAQDANTDSEVTAGLAVFVEEGVTNSDSGWVLTTDSPITLGTTALSFVQFSGAGQITAGEGLSKTGNTLDVNVDDASIEIVTDTLQVKDLGITTAKLNDASVTTAKIANGNVDETKLSASVAGDGLIGGAGSALAVNVDNSTIEISTDTVRVKDAGITEAKLSASVAGEGLIGGVGAPLEVGAGNGIQVNSDSVEVIHSPLINKSLIAGASFVANTSFLVRWAVSGESAGRVYKANSAAAATDGKFYAFGIAHSTSPVSAGGSIDVIIIGSHTLGSSNTAFDAADIGKAVYLTSGGNFSITPPSTTGSAVWRVGMVEDIDKIWLDAKQLNGIN